MKKTNRIFTTLIFIFLYAPMLVLIVGSFNEGKSLSVFSGFSFKWYEELFKDRNTLESVKNTLLLAASATVRISSALAGPTPSTRQSSSGEAFKTAYSEPNLFKRLCAMGLVFVRGIA
mgnify:CR=1 FL=1